MRKETKEPEGKSSLRRFWHDYQSQILSEGIEGAQNLKRSLYVLLSNIQVSGFKYRTISAAVRETIEIKKNYLYDLLHNACCLNE